jgi:hypothetical protein
MKTVVAVFDPLLDVELKTTLLRRRDLRLGTVRTISEMVFRLHSGASLGILTRQLSDGDCWAAIAAIRGEKALGNIPLVLALHQPVSPDDRARSLTAGFADILELPPLPGSVAIITGRLLGLPLRQAERFLVRLQVFEQNSQALGSTMDLSEGGMLVCSQRDVSVGTKLEVRFSLPNVSDELVLEAKVVRVDAVNFQPQRGLAIQFQRVPSRTQAILRDYLEALISKNPFSWEHTSEGGHEVITIFGVPRKPADLVSLHALRGAISFRLKNFFPLTSDAIHLWIEFVRSLERVSRIRLYDCPPAFMQYASRTENLLDRAEIATFFAPYSCDKCQLEETKSIDVGHDLDGGKKRELPSFDCPNCKTPMRFEGLVEQFLSVFQR